MRSKYLKEVKRMHIEGFKKKRPDFPEHAIPQPKYSVKNTNELTKTIKAFVYFCGGFVSRINVQGVYDAKLGKWRQSGADRGVSDLLGVAPDGQALAIEIKWGKDSQSEHQIKWEARFKAAGGCYVIAKDFDSFYEFFTSKYSING